MKKISALFISFIIIAALSAGIFYLVGYVIMGCNDYKNIGNLVSIGIGCGLAGLFGPIIGNYINRITSKKKN